MDQPARSDFLYALVGSTLFWVTVSGIAIRALKIDFLKLESFLKDAYEQTDRFTFSVIETSEAAALKTLQAVYGSHFLRVFAVTCLTSLVLNIYIVGLLHKEWRQRKEEIAVIERTTLTDLSPEYLAITRSPTADSDLIHAFGGASDGRTFRYFNSEAQDIYIRATYDRFQRHIHDYALAKHIGHDLLLAKFFGDSLVYPGWIRGQWFEIVGVFVLGCIANGLVDAFSVLATVFAVKSVFDGQLWRAMLWTSLVAACFVMSLMNYGQFMNGFEGQLFNLSLWLLCSVSLPFLLGLAIAKLTMKWVLALSRVVKVAVTMGALSAILGLSLRTGLIRWVVSWVWWSIPTEFVQNCVYIIRNGIDVHAVMTSMATLFPLLVVISVIATLMVAKGLLILTKTVFLGEVYGASVVSGSTYFVGFLTTLITSTTVGFVLMKWLSHIRK